VLNELTEHVLCVNSTVTEVVYDCGNAACTAYRALLLLLACNEVLVELGLNYLKLFVRLNICTDCE